MLENTSRRWIAHLSGLTFLVAGCQVQSQPVPRQPVQAKAASLRSLDGPAQNFKLLESSPEGELRTDRVEPARRAPRFDDVPDVRQEDAVPGEVSVIFRDQFAIRRNGNGRDFVGGNGADIAALKQLAVTHQLRDIVDFSFGRSEDQLAQDEKQAEAYWGGDIPNKKSIAVLHFPDSVDTSAIAAELRRLPFVLTAFPSGKWTPSATLVSKQDFTTLSGTNVPNDPKLAGLQAVEWHWFNRHKVFHTWNAIGASAPYITVIDDGFDTNTTAWDRPDYQTGASFNSAGTNIGTTVTPTSYSIGGGVKSHGTFVASVLGARKNNNSYGAGVLPSAKIVPLKIVQSTTSFSKAIEYSYDSTPAWVTNVSWGWNGQPISFNPTIRASISYATSRGQVVVIGAGNTYTNLNPSDPVDDAGAIIVGGTDDTGKNWYDGPGNGSNYGACVHLAAVADVYGIDFDYANSSREWKYAAGTSFSTPMVAAAAALVRQEVAIARPTASAGTIQTITKEILWTSATIGQSRNGEQLGKNFNLTTEPGRVRELNMLNAYQLAKLANKDPVVRVFNGDDLTWFAKNSDYNNRYLAPTSPQDMEKSVDWIWNLGNDSFNLYFNDQIPGYDVLSLQTWNWGGNRSHGYQVFRNGVLAHESIGGVAERRHAYQSTTANSMYSTQGEDNNATNTGWNHVYNYVARY